MRTFTIAIAAALALLVVPLAALAQDGDEEQFDTVEALKKVRELLRQSEKSLMESLKPSEAAAKEASDSGEKARKALEDLLRSSRKSGDDAVKQMTEILEKAPRSGGGGGGQSQQQNSGEEPKREEGKQVDEKDPQNSGGGEKPKDPADTKDRRDETAREKPKSKPGEKAEPNPDEEWLANLPPQMRQDYLNKDFGKIPQRWREFIEDYVKRLNEMESSRNR